MILDISHCIWSNGHDRGGNNQSQEKWYVQLAVLKLNTEGGEDELTLGEHIVCLDFNPKSNWRRSIQQVINQKVKDVRPSELPTRDVLESDTRSYRSPEPQFLKSGVITDDQVLE